MNNTLQSLFDFVTAVVFSVGGDGEGWIVYDDYKWLADQFVEYSKSNDGCFGNRTDQPNYLRVDFCQGQECIVFLPASDQVSTYADVVIEVHWDLK